MCTSGGIPSENTVRPVLRNSPWACWAVFQCFSPPCPLLSQHHKTKQHNNPSSIEKHYSFKKLPQKKRWKVKSIFHCLWSWRMDNQFKFSQDDGWVSWESLVPASISFLWGGDTWVLQSRSCLLFNNLGLCPFSSSIRETLKKNHMHAPWNGALLCYYGL